MELSENFETSETGFHNNNNSEAEASLVIDVPASIALERYRPDEPGIEELNAKRKDKPLRTTGVGVIQNAKCTKFFPKRLQERYEAIVNDPDYVSLREQIAFLELRRQELMRRIKKGDSVKRRKDLVKELEKVQERIATGPLGLDSILKLEEDLLDAGQALPPHLQRRLETMTASARSIGADLYAISQDARNERRQDETNQDCINTSESLRKLKETEVKRMVAANQVLTITESYYLITRIATMVEEWVMPLSKEIAAKLIRELHSLLNRR